MAESTIKLTVDTSGVTEALERIQHYRKQCAVATCSQEGLERNRIEEAVGGQRVQFLVCDGHFEQMTAYWRSRDATL